MSQEKVDKYKQEKANRKKNMQKEKVKHIFRRCIVGVLGIALIGWIGYSGYNVYESNQPKKQAEVDYTAIENYQQNLNSTDTAE